MRFKLIFLGSLLFFQSYTQNDNGYNLWKNMYNNCESLKGGTYSGVQKMKNLTSRDTIINELNCIFQRDTTDQLFGSYFDVSCKTKNGVQQQYSYNSEFFISCLDTNCSLYQGENELRKLDRLAHNYLLYYPFNNIGHSEMALMDSIDLIFVGEEKVSNWDVFHYKVEGGVDTSSMVKVLSSRYEFWINKKDLMPVKYSVYYMVDLAGVISEQFEEFKLVSYHVNDLKKSQLHTLQWYSDNSYAIQSESAIRKKVESLKVGDIVPKWELTTNHKQRINSSDHEYKLVLFDFFYQSCYPCLKAIPMLNQLNEKYGNKGLLVVGIDNVDPKDERFYEFLKERKIAYPVAISENALSKDFKVSSYPTLFLMDSTGKLLFTSSGFGPGSEKELDELIDSLLKGK